MTVSLNNVAVQQFKDSFDLVYQGSKMILDNMTQLRRGVVGDAYKWPVLGKATMLTRGAPQSAVPASDVDHIQITTTFEDFVLNLPTDIFQQSNVNANEQAALAQDHADAIGRREDQTRINALDTAGLTKVIANGGTDLTVDKLREAAKLLDNDDVPSADRFFIVTPEQIDSLLRETEVTSSDFNTVKALVMGDVKTYMGFQFIKIGTARPEGGIPKTGNIRRCFAWHSRSLGVAYSLNPSVEAKFEFQFQSWLSISRMKLGASIILPEGAVQIDCDETA